MICYQEVGFRTSSTKSPFQLSTTTAAKTCLLPLVWPHFDKSVIRNSYKHLDFAQNCIDPCQTSLVLTNTLLRAQEDNPWVFPLRWICRRKERFLRGELQQVIIEKLTFLSNVHRATVEGHWCTRERMADGYSWARYQPYYMHLNIFGCHFYVHPEILSRSQNSWFRWAMGSSVPTPTCLESTWGWPSTNPGLKESPGRTSPKKSAGRTFPWVAGENFS